LRSFQLQSLRRAPVIIVKPMLELVTSHQSAAVSGRQMRALWLVASSWLAASLALCPVTHAQLARQVNPGFEAVTNRDAEARRTTMARALFDEGVRYLDAGRWTDAQDRFARVIDLRYSPVALYNLGLAQARCGRGVVAAATLRKLLADPGLEPKVREPAATLLAEVEAKFGWITLRVAKACESCRAYVDQEEWPLAALDVAVPIDPGTHALELRRGASLLAAESVDVSAGTWLETVIGSRLGSLDAAQAARASADRTWRATTPSNAAHSGSNVLESPWFWGAMGALAAGIATTIVIETR
jgi:hypothetical protein